MLLNSISWPEFAKISSVITGLIILQLGLGKKASYPYGLLFGLNLYLITGLVILTDLILMLFIEKVISSGVRILEKFDFIRQKKINLKRFLSDSKIGIYLQHLGKLGVLIITALPFAGGVWSGAALSKMVNLSRPIAIILLTIGVIIGASIFHFGSLGIITVI